MVGALGEPAPDLHVGPQSATAQGPGPITTGFLVAGKVIITTENGDEEICGVVYDEAHARLMAHAPKLLAALKALHAAVILSRGGDAGFTWANVYAGILIDKAEGRS